MTRPLFHRRPSLLTRSAWGCILFALICAAAGAVLYFTKDLGA